MSKKLYCSFERLHEWVVAHHQDQSDPYYSDYTDFSLAFTSILPIFDGTKTYADPQTLHNQTPTIIYYPKIFEDINEIIQIYDFEYEERLLAFPLKIGFSSDYDAAMHKVLMYFKNKIYNFVLTNEEKYLRILALLNLKYNPIDNYDKVEYEDLGYSGKEKIDRDIKARQLSGVKISGPSTDASITYGAGETPGSLSGNFNTNYKKNSAVAQVGDTVNGRKAGDATVNESSGVTTASTTDVGGSTPTSNHYTTTYDNAATNRLESYDTTTGTVATSQKGTSSEDVPTMIEAYSGSPNTPSYTDTKEFENREDNRQLRTWGNAGTTLTQDMIIKEQQILKEGWNVVEMFCKELNREIFLQCYDY